MHTHTEDTMATRDELPPMFTAADVADLLEVERFDMAELGIDHDQRARMMSGRVDRVGA